MPFGGASWVGRGASLGNELCVTLAGCPLSPWQCLSRGNRVHRGTTSGCPSSYSALEVYARHDEWLPSRGTLLGQPLVTFSDARPFEGCEPRSHTSCASRPVELAYWRDLKTHRLLFCFQAARGTLVHSSRARFSSIIFSVLIFSLSMNQEVF